MLEREHIWISHFNRVERKSSRSSTRTEAGAAGELAVLARSSEHLGMDVAFVSEFAQGEQVYRRIEGDAESFGFREDGSIALEGTFCRRLIDGNLANVVPDAKSDERVKGLDVTRDADIGSYVGVPLRFSDGRLYGTLCCLSHLPDPSLRDRDGEFMRVLARLRVEQLEREELESKNWRLRIEATGVGALLAALEARDGYTGSTRRPWWSCRWRWRDGSGSPRRR